MPKLVWVKKRAASIALGRSATNGAAGAVLPEPGRLLLGTAATAAGLAPEPLGLSAVLPAALLAALELDDAGLAPPPPPHAVSAADKKPTAAHLIGVDARKSGKDRTGWVGVDTAKERNLKLWDGLVFLVNMT